MKSENKMIGSLTKELGQALEKKKQYKKIFFLLTDARVFHKQSCTSQLIVL